MAFTTFSMDSIRRPAGARRAGLSWPRLRDMIALARQRRALAELPAERLADIGLTPEQARAEASRPFWDAPRTWRG